MKLKLSHKAMLLVAVPLAFQLAFLASLNYMLDRSERDLAQQEHARTVVSKLNGLLSLFLNAAGGASGFSLTGDSGLEKRYQHASDAVPDKIAELRKITAGNAEETDYVNKINDMFAEALDRFHEVKRSVHDKEIFTAMKLLHETRPLFMAMYAAFDEATAAEKHMEDNVPYSQAQLRIVARRVLWLAAVGSVLVAITITIGFNRSTTRRLALLVENTNRFGTGKPLLPRVPGHDEIAHLDGVFHDMASKVEEAQRLKEQFVSVVSHELRTPLMNVQGILTLLESGMYGQLNENGSEQVQVAYRNTERLMTLINDLLIIDKLESGMVEIMPVETDLQTVFERSVEAVMSLAGRKHLDVRIDAVADCTVSGDSDRLIQVITNLLSNAIKFSDKGQSITVSSEREGTDMVRVHVRDQGRGIPADQVDKVFDRYVQAQSSDSKIGAGLGLSICKAIVEKHGGRIGVTSKLGEGSDFWFDLPVFNQAVAIRHKSVTQEV